MLFDLNNLRQMNYETPLKIRGMKRSPLILVEADGSLAYGKTGPEKDKLMERFDPREDVMLFPWAGQYSTDVFRLTEDDLTFHY